jgi:hypothetical protein
MTFASRRRQVSTEFAQRASRWGRQDIIKGRAHI